MLPVDRRRAVPHSTSQFPVGLKEVVGFLPHAPRLSPVKSWLLRTRFDFQVDRRVCQVLLMKLGCHAL